MRVIADSHASVWYGHDSPKLAPRASAVVDDAIAGDGLVISVVSTPTQTNLSTTRFCLWSTCVETRFGHIPKCCSAFREVSL